MWQHSLLEQTPAEKKHARHDLVLTGDRNLPHVSDAIIDKMLGHELAVAVSGPVGCREALVASLHKDDISPCVWQLRFSHATALVQDRDGKAWGGSWPSIHGGWIKLIINKTTLGHSWVSVFGSS
jgi:hypothetical protein